MGDLLPLPIMGLAVWTAFSVETAYRGHWMTTAILAWGLLALIAVVLLTIVVYRLGYDDGRGEAKP